MYVLYLKKQQHMDSVDKTTTSNDEPEVIEWWKGRSSGSQFVSTFNRVYADYFRGVLGAHPDNEAVKSHCTWITKSMALQGADTTRLVDRFRAEVMNTSVDAIFEQKIGALNRTSPLLGVASDAATHECDAKDDSEEDWHDDGLLNIYSLYAQWGKESRSLFWKTVSNLQRTAHMMNACGTALGAFEEVAKPFQQQVLRGELKPDQMQEKLLEDLMSGGKMMDMFELVLRDPEHRKSLMQNVGLAMQPEKQKRMNLSGFERLMTDGMDDESAEEALKAVTSDEFADMGDTLKSMMRGFHAGGDPMRNIQDMAKQLEGNDPEKLREMFSKFQSSDQDQDTREDLD